MGCAPGWDVTISRRGQKTTRLMLMLDAQGMCRFVSYGKRHFSLHTECGARANFTTFKSHAHEEGCFLFYRNYIPTPWESTGFNKATTCWRPHRAVTSEPKWKIESVPRDHRPR